MADEVPIPDVLCEAMEYLCKLGSNLRTRSETLKEKRIRKDKLRNTHAVQKAASKVLLICELAKKSIDNVETGVKRVLSRVDTIAVPTKKYGGKSSEDIEKKEPKGFYIEYKSRKLRIAQKISLKHFMSVKVTAKNMPISMQDRYPVYYNSKLYRQRKRASLKEQSQGKNTISICNKEKQDDSSHMNTDEQEDMIEHNEDTDNETKSNTDGTSDVIKETTPEISNSDDNSPVARTLNAEEDKEPVVTDKDTRKSLVDISDDISMTESIGTKNIKSSDHKHSRRKKVRFVVSSDEESNSLKPEEDSKRSSSPEVELINNNDTCENPTPGNSDQESGTRNKETKKSDSDEETTDSKPVIRCVNIAKLLKSNVLPKENEKSAKNFNSSKHSIVEKTKLIEKERSNSEEYCKEKQKEVELFKSKGFSIHIKRLPDLSETFLVSQNLKKITKDGSILCKVNSENDECTETNIDLSSRNVKQAKTDAKCSENGNDSDNKTEESVLNESEIEKHEASEKNTKKGSKKDKTIKSRKRISTVVLHDSDSDSNGKTDKDKDATQEVIKKSLLHDSDSESNKDSNDKETQGEIKKSSLNESDSYKKKSQKNTNECNNKLLANDSDSDKPIQKGIKESLLNESDSDNNNADKTQKNTGKTKNNISNDSDSQEGIKKSLLNDSDSDKDSADSTKLKTALTKETLLNNSDSNDNGSKDKSIEKVTDELIDALVNVAKESDAVDTAPADTEKQNALEPHEETNIEFAVGNLIKKSLLKDSDSDNDKQSGNINKESEKAKEGLESQEQDIQSKEDLSPSKVKKSLLNDSSSQTGDDSSPTKKKVKLSKSKRDLAKKNISYSSSSDEDNKSDDGKNIKSRRRSRHSSSSSDNNKKKRKKRKNPSDNEDDSKSKSRSKKVRY